MTTPHSKIDIANWKRKDQYHFFLNFEQPSFNTTVNLNVNSFLQDCRSKGHSFFLSSVFHALQTVNEIDELRYRVVDGEVLDFKTINAGVTILQDDETFIYCTLEYHADLETFLKESHAAIEIQKKTRGFKAHNRLDVVFFSVLPWVSFTSISHAMNNSPSIYVPRIVFGKYFEQGEQLRMPVALQVHHALSDGFHVGKFFMNFQTKLESL